MLAGGLGNIRADHVAKGKINPGDKLVVLGGPAMLIGLGGGAASSMASGHGNEDLDFASEQRDNAEMERRSQEVIDRCWALGADNPISFIHDVGAAVYPTRCRNTSDKRRRVAAESSTSASCPTTSRACRRSKSGATSRRSATSSPSPPAGSKPSRQLCARERAPFAIVGEAIEEKKLVVEVSHFQNTPIDMPLEVLLGKPPRMHRKETSLSRPQHPLDLRGIDLKEAVRRVLSHPTVADKTFLISIGDRTLGGLIARDQMVGPWQVPVADCAVTAATYDVYTRRSDGHGRAHTGAVNNAAASARLAVGEAITNLAAAQVGDLGKVNLSANWMAAPAVPGDAADLYAAVQAVGMECAPHSASRFPSARIR